MLFTDNAKDAERADVAFVGWQSLAAVMPHVGRRVGGLETAMWTLARGMAASGKHRVAVLCSVERYPAVDQIDGVALWVVKDRWRRMRQEVGDAVDLVHWRLKRWDARLLWRIPLLAMTYPFRPRDVATTAPEPRMFGFRPRAWCVFGVSDDAARAVACARQQQIPIALFLQSNADVTEDLLRDDAPPHPYGDSRTGRLFALQRADVIVCQTQWQVDALADRFGRQGILIRNPIDLRRWQQAKTEPGQYVLWVGRYDTFHKRPELLLQVARACSNIPFLMICNQFDLEVQRRLSDKIPANVRVVDYVPHEEMPSVFKSARLFVSTGNPAHEGFPNVLLQAAATHTPIVSLEDYDAFVQRSGAGIVCRDVEKMATAINKMWHAVAGQVTVGSDYSTPPSEAPPMSMMRGSGSVDGVPLCVDWANVDRYLIEHHDLSVIVEQANVLFEGLIAGRSTLP